MSEEIELIRELHEYEKDKKKHELALNAERMKYAMLLKGEMGQDMKDVLSGKKKVQLTFREKMSFKIRNVWQGFMSIIDKIFKTF